MLNFWVEKNVCIGKKIWLKNFLGQKKIFGSKKIFGLKFFWVQKKSLVRKNFLGQKYFLGPKFFLGWKIIYWFRRKVGVELTQGEVESSIHPLPTENDRVKLWWVVVTLVLWGRMQNFRSLGYSPGWGGWVVLLWLYSKSQSNQLKLIFDWLGLGLSLAKCFNWPVK